MDIIIVSTQISPENTPIIERERINFGVRCSLKLPLLEVLLFSIIKIAFLSLSKIFEYFSLYKINLLNKIGNAKMILFTSHLVITKV